MMNYPLVSVIIPTYNYGRFIGEAIDSVLTSDFSRRDMEIIIVDDGSTDDTADKVASYQDQVAYLYQENMGKAYATHVAISQARGQYIFNLDADDFFRADKLKKVVAIFESDPEIVHVAHPAIHWDMESNTKIIEKVPLHVLNQKQDGKALLSYFYRKRMLFGGGTTFAARTKTLRSFEIPQTVDMYIDEYLVLATFNQGYSFFLEDPLSTWRIHSQNFSKNKSTLNQKWQRSLASVEGVLNQLSKLGIEEDVIRLYDLKTQALSLLMKEQLQTKTWLDIFDLWHTIAQNSKFFGLEIIEIIRNLKLLNRSLPTPLISLAKQVSRV